ncbi:hypothetical protein UlMin_024661 [Ulmus minor]
MGIPSFYRWLTERYPRSVVDVVEEQVAGGEPADTTKPNPNGKEFDNLYLDMNGIVHPCFHPEGLPPPKSYEEVFQAVFKYIDRIFSIVRPRKLLFLAIDGVAPRAKMNQQRSRRFRAAKDAADELATQNVDLGNVSESKDEFPSLEQSTKLDSNVITPGTEFMALLSSALSYYIHLRMNGDLGWRGIKVILSDASVPGEGEHKIMSYIRLQRNLPKYDPNTNHCIYGLDADLIMLALATHEVHFSILREDVQKAGLKDKSSKSRTDSLVNQGEVNESIEDYITKQKFQFLNVRILREYLAFEMKIPSQEDGDLERLIDDFVFMCLFVGNDFLPHVPSLEISEGAIDLLVTIYKEEFGRMGGYLTNSFEVNLERVELFLQAVGSHEGAILRKRVQIKKERDMRDRRNNKFRKLPAGQDPINPSAMATQAPTNTASNGTNAEVDKIKLGEDGWKERYYDVKFEAETEIDCERILRDVVLKYTEGICWVMRYYYEGVCSWQWFYPYHYAPFASDFVGINQLKIHFTLGAPFKPFDQLMAVLPAASAHALPSFYRKLMIDTSSPLLSFYPTDFELDMNGKRFSWQATCKLPFIEESLLLLEIAKIEHTLTDEERRRNSLGLDVLFVHMSHPLAMGVLSFYRINMGDAKLSMVKVKQEIDPKLSGGMNGYFLISDKPVQPVQIESPIDGMEMIANNQVLSVFYECPPFHEHVPRPSYKVNFPRKSIRKSDIKPTPVLWHEKLNVVGRLHSLRPIRNSIFGPALAKWAHQLVSKWCLENPQKQSLEPSNWLSAGKLHTVLPCYTVVDGKSKNGKTKKRKRSSDNVPADVQVGANGQAPISVLGETTSAGDTGDGKNSNGGDDGKSANDKKMRQKMRRKLLKERALADARLGSVPADVQVGANGQAPISVLGETTSAGDTGDGKSSNGGGDAKSNNDKNRRRKMKRKLSKERALADARLGSVPADVQVGANVQAPNLVLGETISAGDTGEKPSKERALADAQLGSVPSNAQVGADVQAPILVLGETISVGDTGEKPSKERALADAQLGSGPSNAQVGADVQAPILVLGETISVGDTGDGKSCSGAGDGESTDKKTRGRLRKMRRKMLKKRALADASLGGNGPASDSTLGETIYTGDIGDNKSCFDGILGNSLGGDESKCQLKVEQTALSGSPKHKRKQDDNRGDSLPNDHGVANGLAGQSNLEERICLEKAEGENIVAVQSKKRKKKRNKGNAVSEGEAILSANGPEGDKNNSVGICVELKQKQGEGNDDPENNVGKDRLNPGEPVFVVADGLAGKSNLEERICVEKAEGENIVAVKSKKRKKKRSKGNAVSEGEAILSANGPEGDKNNIVGICSELKQKQGEGNDDPENNVGKDWLNPGEPVFVVADGLAGQSNLEERICVEKAEGENIVAVQSKKRKKKRNKGNAVSEGEALLSANGPEGDKNNSVGICVELKQKQGKGNDDPENNVSKDRLNPGEPVFVVADGLAGKSNLEERICVEKAEGENMVAVQSKKRKKKQNKGNAVSEGEAILSANGPEGDKNNTVGISSELKQKQGEGNDDPENNVGKDRLSLGEPVFVVGSGEDEKCLDGKKKRRKRRNQKIGNATSNEGGDGLVDSSSAKTTPSGNGPEMDKNGISSELKQKQGEGNGDRETMSVKDGLNPAEPVVVGTGVEEKCPDGESSKRKRKRRKSISNNASVTDPDIIQNAENTICAGVTTGDGK